MIHSTQTIDGGLDRCGLSDLPSMIRYMRQQFSDEDLVEDHIDRKCNAFQREQEAILERTWHRILACTLCTSRRGPQPLRHPCYILEIAKHRSCLYGAIRHLWLKETTCTANRSSSTMSSEQKVSGDGRMKKQAGYIQEK